MDDGNSFAVNVYSLYSSSSGINALSSDFDISESDLPLFLSLVLILPFYSKLSCPGKGLNIGSKPSDSLIA